MRWLGLALLSALSLQWFVVASSPLAVGRFHQAALLAFAAIIWVVFQRRSALGPVLRLVLPFVVATVFMLMAWTVVEVFQGDLPIKPIQQFLYLGAFLAVATFFYRTASEQQGSAVDMLRWSAAACGLTVTLAFVASMLKTGISFLDVTQQAIDAADPAIFVDNIYRASFGVFGLDPETVLGNIRHEVFAAVLLAMYVSAWAVRYRPLTTLPARAAYRASMIFGIVLLIFSLSRSIVLAALVWPVVVLIKAALVRRLTRTQIRVGVEALVLAALVLASGFGAVLWSRTAARTESYEGRVFGLRDAIAGIRDHFLFGGAEEIGVTETSHNFVLDAWLRAGVFVALPAVAIVVMLVGLWIFLLLRVHREPDWMLPVTVALALPLVRLVTAGGGLINPVEWVTLGFIAGVLAVRREKPAATSARRPTLTATRA